MVDRRASIYLAVFSLLGVILITGVTPVFIRYFADHIDAWTANGIRYAVGTLICIPWIFGMRDKWRNENARVKSVWLAAVPVALANLAAQILWGWTPYFAEAPVIGFLIRTEFLFTMGFGFLLIRAERRMIRYPLFWVGAVACAIGTLLMFEHRMTGLGSTDTHGIMLILGAAAMFGFYHVIIVRYLTDYPIRLAFGVVALYTAVALLILMLCFGDVSAVGALSLEQGGYLLLSGVLGVTCGHLLFYHAMKIVGPIVSSGSIQAGPFITYLGAAIILGEGLRDGQWVGGLILIGSALVLLRVRWKLSHTDR